MKERRKKACKVFFDPIARAFFSDVNNLAEHILHCQNTAQPSLLFEPAERGREVEISKCKQDRAYIEIHPRAFGVFKRFFSLNFSFQSDFSRRAASKNKRGKLRRDLLLEHDFSVGKTVHRSAFHAFPIFLFKF